MSLQTSAQFIIHSRKRLEHEFFVENTKGLNQLNSANFHVNIEQFQQKFDNKRLNQEFFLENQTAAKKTQKRAAQETYETEKDNPVSSINRNLCRASIVGG